MGQTIIINGYPSGRETKSSIQWVADNGETLIVTRAHIVKDRGSSLEIDEEYAQRHGWNTEVLNQTGEVLMPVEETRWDTVEDIPEGDVYAFD